MRAMINYFLKQKELSMLYNEDFDISKIILFYYPVLKNYPLDY
jgi:hypothetical protein